MDDPILMVGVEHDDDGNAVISSPGVGWWTSLPEPGSLVGPGNEVGALTRLNRRFRLVMPDGAAGRVLDGLPRLRAVAVEYGEVLFRLSPMGAVDGAGHLPEPGSLGRATRDELGANARAIVSPTDGVFYRRPAPDAPPFVEPGGKIRLGQPVGLVEVMKTFNQILYEGPGYPEEAEVVEIRVDDTQEVSAGQVLVVVR